MRNKTPQSRNVIVSYLTQASGVDMADQSLVHAGWLEIIIIFPVTNDVHATTSSLQLVFSS